MFASRGNNVSVLVFDSLKATTSGCKQSVNMVLNVHRNDKAYKGRGEGAEVGMEVGEEGDYIPTATLSPSE